MGVYPGSYSPFDCLLALAGDCSAEGVAVTLPLPFPLEEFRLPEPCAEDGRPLASLFDLPPMILSRASWYLRCFSSRSIFALACLSTKLFSAFFLSSCSESSSSSIFRLARPEVGSGRAITFGGGFRLRTFSGPLNSSFNGTSSRAKRKMGFSGASLGLLEAEEVPARRRTLRPIFACWLHRASPCALLEIA